MLTLTTRMQLAALTSLGHAYDGVPVECIYRYARWFRIYEGTSQVLQFVIARWLVDRNRLT